MQTFTQRENEYSEQEKAVCDGQVRKVRLQLKPLNNPLKLQRNDKEIDMPKGKGTYGSKVGRPPKMSGTKKKPVKKK